MTQFKNLALGTVSAVVLAVGFVSTAAAQNVYGGGATLPAIAYCLDFDCYGTQYGFPIALKCPAPYGAAGLFLYAPVGSGAGIDAFITNSSSRLGVPAGTNTVPFADNTGPQGVFFSTVAPTGYG